MYILKWYFTDEVAEMKVCKNFSPLKKLAEDRFDGTGLYKEISFQSVGDNIVFVLGDGEEIGVIAKIEEIT